MTTDQQGNPVAECFGGPCDGCYFQTVGRTHLEVVTPTPPMPTLPQYVYDHVLQRFDFVGYQEQGKRKS